MNIENIETFNWKGAIRGMRNPMNSWHKSDTVYDMNNSTDFQIGEDDMKLMINLSKAGSDHRKFMRQIFISCDITTSLKHWKQIDTYKIGTVANSCSTMHKIHSTAITLDDFWITPNADDEYLSHMDSVISKLNYYRDKFLETGDKKYWEYLVDLLPESYLQRRTFTMNYETVFNMYYSRRNHKLLEWRMFVEILKDNLPYFNQLILHDKG